MPANQYGHLLLLFWLLAFSDYCYINGVLLANGQYGALILRAHYRVPLLLKNQLTGFEQQRFIAGTENRCHRLKINPFSFDGFVRPAVDMPICAMRSPVS